MDEERKRNSTGMEERRKVIRDGRERQRKKRNAIRKWGSRPREIRGREKNREDRREGGRERWN
eukprot:3673873-Rhodomonas_salina.1